MEKKLITIAEKLLKDLYGLKKGETLIITADTWSDMEVVEEVQAAASEQNIQWMTALIKAPGGVAAAAEPEMPGESIAAMLCHADAWAEFNKMWIYGSPTYIKIMENNPKMRHMCLTGATGDLLTNCIGGIDYQKLQIFGNRLAEKIGHAKKMRMTSEKGMDITFSNLSERPVLKELGHAERPGTNMLPGQIAWTPDIESVNGTLVFDGALAPVCGVPKNPVKLVVEAGVVREITGGEEAEAYRKWLESFEHPQMFGISHTGIGINPGAKLSGDILQDQRVWGSVTWAVGSIGGNLVPPSGVAGPSHSDCVSLEATIWIDGEEIFRNGKIIDEELKSLAAGLEEAS